KLQALPEDLHWFCPRVGPDDNTVYDDGEGNGDASDSDTDKRSVARRVQDGKKRSSLAFSCMEIIAFDGSDAESLKQNYQHGLDLQLGRCDSCVKAYYRTLPGHIESLEGSYDLEAVEAFRETVNNMNNRRIVNSLKAVTKKLQALAPEKRSIGTIDQSGALAIFEPLCCTNFLRNEDLLRDYFDEPFNLIQSNKRLKMTCYTPAMTSFLFSGNEYRYNWAYITVIRWKDPITRVDFDWAIRDFLHEAMERVNISNLDVDFLPAFWNGVRIIVGKLDKDLITHSLRAMDSDIYRLALDHLQLESDGFQDLLGSLQVLLLKSPSDFWNAMGTISPVTVVEQVFNAPVFERILRETGQDGSSQLDDLQDTLSWVEPFVASIKAINQTPATRAILQQLIIRLQNDRYSQLVKDYCYSMGLRTLDLTLRDLLATQATKAPISEATVSEILTVVEEHIPEICSDIRSLRASTSRVEEANLGLQILQHAISLDCHVLVVDFEKICQRQTLHHHKDVQSTSFWRSVVKNIGKRDSKLAVNVLLGCRPLTGLEPFVLPTGKSLSPEQKHFNESFDRISGYVVDVLEKVTDFSESELRGLLKDLNNATALFATLFSSSREVHEAALEVLKAASGQTGRKEALEFALENSLSTTLSMTSNYLRVVGKRPVFAPMPRALKIGGDLVDVLCDPQNGILRARTLSWDESKVVEEFWRAIWHTLSVIFDATENWSMSGHNKDMLKDFCRDTMQVAGRLFDEYAIFATAIREAGAAVGKKASASSTAIHLLQNPKNATKGIVKWLRLRDEYLSTKSVSLICKLLVRFHDESVDFDQDSLTYIEGIIYGTTRAKLSRQQTAELKSALETHTGQSLDDDDVEEILPSRATSTAGSKKDSAKSSENDSADDELRKLIAQNTKGSEMYKARQEQKKADILAKKKADEQRREAALAAKKAAAAQASTGFLERRKREKEAKERRDAAAREQAKKLRIKPDEASGAGSGIIGVGVRREEQLPKEKGMYVEDETTDEEADIDRQLFGIIRPKTKKAEEKGLKQQPQGPVKKKKIIRSANDMRARIAPDLSPLHKTILGWDYFATGDFPPGSRRDLYSHVPNKFPSPVHYQQVFQPLLELEAWQGLVKSREENTFKTYEIKISNRSSVDAFVEVSTTMTQADNKEIQISEGDLILMSKHKAPSSAIDMPHCLARVFRTLRKKAVLEISYRVMPGSKLISSLIPNSSIYGVKIQSMTPLEREYGALRSLQFYDLCDEIVSAKPSPLLDYNDRQLEPLISNYNVNKAQAKAVKSAVDNDAFTLIQGPPGSGKTKTIVAIVGALLSSTLAIEKLAPLPAARGPAIPVANVSPAKKLLVCAPSNAAVDELVMRFKEGVKTLSGDRKKINVVRLGRSDAINTQVVDVTLDELVNARLNTMPGQGSDNRAKNQEIFKEHKMVSDTLNEARAKLDSGMVKGAEASKLRDEVDALRRRKAQLGTAIDNVRDQENANDRQNELNRRRVQQSILDESHIICATLSGSGHDMFRSLNVEFETVVVDEAAQCVEMSALIPLKYGCSKCILVGDPKQLPPTVFSKEAAKFQYEQSLFVRMQGNHPEYVHLLDTQYRMHPDISAFPSQSFYDSRLLDGPNMATLRKRPWHSNTLLAPYRFFDVQGQHQAAPKGHSLINIAEIEIAISLFEKLTREYAGYDFKGKIGIITPYKSQLRELKDRFLRRYGQSVFETVEFNTTDAYQGRESEVIIFSCVRASPAGGIGFLQDIRRMNVGLTRAKSSLWVLGNSESLVRGDYWRMLVEDARKRRLYSEGNLKHMLANSTAAAWKPDTALIEQQAVKYQPEPAQEPSFSDKMDIDPIPIRESVARAQEAVSSTSIPAKRRASTRSDSDEDMKDYVDDASSGVPPSEKSETARPSATPAGQAGASRPPKKKKAANPLLAPNRPPKPRPS
ncbi:tRNA-splicing endonuclease-like protein, partial [Rhizodiscina lignyota]